MYNRRFLDAVRSKFINLLSPAAQTLPGHSGSKISIGAQDGVAIFLDYQNLWFLLKNAFEISPARVNLPALLEEIAAEHKLPVREIHLFTGVPDPKHDAAGSDQMQRRLAWFRHLGLQVHSLPMQYVPVVRGGRLKALERGVDILLATTMMKRVSEGVTKVLVISQDKSFSQSIRIAAEVAMGKGQQLDAYSICAGDIDAEDLKRKHIGFEGLAFTQKLPVNRSLVAKHVMQQQSREVQGSDALVADAQAH